MGYRDTSAFLLCFSVVEPWTLQNIKDKWWPELKPYRHDVDTGGQTQFVLVGTKADLMDDQEAQKKNVTNDQSSGICTKKKIEVIRKLIGATSYIETSARS